MFFSFASCVWLARQASGRGILPSPDSFGGQPCVAQMAFRLHSNLQRRTLCSEELPMPTKQFWYEERLQIIWWDLDLLFQAERHVLNKAKMKKSKWLRRFNERVAPLMPMANHPFFIRDTKAAGAVINCLSARATGFGKA